MCNSHKKPRLNANKALFACLSVIAVNIITLYLLFFLITFKAFGMAVVVTLFWALINIVAVALIQADEERSIS